MGMRKRKYIKIIDFNNFIKINTNNILLFVHANNLNFVEATFVKIFITQQNITTFQISTNLMKRICVNENFFNLLAGPTRIYAFNSLASILLFCQEKYIIQKLIPLAILWNNNFFCYKFFIEYIKVNFFKHLETSSLYTKQLFLLTFLNSNKIKLNFILLQQTLLKSLINILSLLKNTVKL